MRLVRAYLLPDDGSSALVAFDLTTSEAHESTCEVTEHPVEGGANITDHIIDNRDTLSLEVYVTNTPSTDLGGRGASITRPLVYPRYQPPFALTPGALTRSAIGVVRDLVGAAPAQQVTVLTFSQEMDRVKETHDALLDIKRRKVICSVITSTQTYESMALIRVGMPRDHSGGSVFNMDLRAIATATSATVKAPEPAEPRGVRGQNKGAQATKPTDDQKKAKVRSLAAQGLDFGIKSFGMGG